MQPIRTVSEGEAGRRSLTQAVRLVLAGVLLKRRTHGTNSPHSLYESWTFAEVAKQQKVRVPQIHLLIGNRLTQFEGPATAFAALSDATSKVFYDIYKQNPSYFVNATKTISTKEQFRNYYSIPLRDFNKAGVVCAHLGRLLSSMKQGYYKVYGIELGFVSTKTIQSS